jgi:hypothetical protein
MISVRAFANREARLSFFFFFFFAGASVEVSTTFVSIFSTFSGSS